MELYRRVELEDMQCYRVNDVIAFTLNDGEEVEALAVKQEDDGMIFYFVDSLIQGYRMNPAHSNGDGYKKCELRKKLNGEILDRFPVEIREKMIAFENGDLLRLATEREILGENIYGEYEDESVQQWEPMKDRRNRIGFQGSKTGFWKWYWLQNKSRNYAANFCGVTPDGAAGNGGSGGSGGVRSVFKLHRVGDIDVLPRVDAVDVVRCRECRLWEEHCGGRAGICSKRRGVAKANDFCSCGERKIGARQQKENV